MTRRRHDHGQPATPGQGDLLDLLQAQEATDPDTGTDADAADVSVHILMPNMGLACGRDTLTVLRSRRREGAITTMPDRATCADCLAVPDLARRIHAMQTPLGKPKRRRTGEPR